MHIYGAPGPYSYEWKVNTTGTNWDNTPVFGTNDYIGIQASNYNVGDIIFVRLKVTAGNGDVEIQYHAIEVIEQGTKVDCTFPRKTTIKETFNVYPNPAINEINVEYTVKENVAVTINISDLYGRKVKEINLGTQNQGRHMHTADISNLSNSIYIMEIRTNKERNAIKFIKSSK